ncbi:Cytochrome P450 305a1 [Carabus blaptoides fortunei]
MPSQIGYNLLLDINKEMKELFMDTIREHHDTWQPDKKDNLIYAYITEMYKCEENKKSFTDDQLIMIFLDLFLGASQTSGTTLTFLLLRMLLHPDVQEKAFRVINESLNPNNPLSYADRVKVPYIEAIILEASRLYPISALAAPRRVLRDTTLDGYTIPAGTTVYANIYAVHHSVEYWEDPEVFRPERFLDAAGNVHSVESVISFGLGKRRCLGELLARQCVFIFFIGILQKYQICPVPDTTLPSSIPGNGILLTTQKYNARPHIHPSSKIGSITSI